MTINNLIIQKGLIFAVVFVGVALSVAIYLFPDRAVLFLDRLPIKFILILIGWLLMALIAVIIYFKSYVPPVRRLVVSTWRFMISISILSTSASILGVPSLASASFNPKDPSVLNFEWEAATQATSWTLAVALLSVIITAWMYIYLLQYEQKHGPLIVD